MKALTRPVIVECTLLLHDGGASPHRDCPRRLELTLECGPAVTGTHLSAAFESRYGPGLYTVSGTPLDLLSPGRDPLVTGCVVLGPSFPETREPHAPREAGAHLDLVVLSGPDAGSTFPLRRGDHHLGRGGPSLRLTDPSLSRDHAVLAVSAEAIVWTDRGSLHGTTVDGRELRGSAAVSTESVIRCGATEFALRPTALWQADLTALGESQGTPHHVTPPQRQQGRPATVLMAAGPLLGSLALSWGTGTWQFTLLSLLSSAPFLYPALTGDGAVRRFREQVEQAVAEDRERRESAFPSMGSLLLARSAALPGPSTTLSAAPHHGPPDGDAPSGGDQRGVQGPGQKSGLWLRVGTGDSEADIACRPESGITRRAIRPWSLHRAEFGRTAGTPGDRQRSQTRRVLPSTECFRSRRRAGAPWTRGGTSPLRRIPPIVLRDVPTVVRADPGMVVVAGHSDYVEFVSGLIVQLVRRPRRRRPAIVLVDPRRVLPSSLRFLPGVCWVPGWDEALAQRTTAAEQPSRVVIGAPAEPLPDVLETQTVPEAVALVIHGTASPGAAFSRTPPGFSIVRIDRTLGVVTSPHRQAGPMPGRDPADPSTRRFVPDLVSSEILDRFCRSFSRLTGTAGTAERGEEHLTIPGTVPLRSLVPAASREMVDAWHTSCATGSFGFPVGASKDGTATLDLVQDGPHILVAGTTGAGKSELLRTVVLSAAAHLPPSDLGFVLVDFKGGAAFDGLSTLPHVHGLVTDLGPAELDRALTSLRAEITHRERLFRGIGVSDWAGYRRVRTLQESPLPRLCLVIDEFRMMVDHAPDSLRELIRLASIGRSLGLHLLLATQRPQGAVSADIRANLGTSIALRVASDLDSLDVIGTPQAARIPTELPGRAVVARGGSRSMIQVADHSAVPSIGDDEVRIKTWSDPESSATAAQSDERSGGHLAAWRRELSAAWNAWRSESEAPRRGPRRVVAPALPERFDPYDVTREALPPSVGPEGQPPLALVDRPDHQELTVLHWWPGESVALIGSPSDRGPLAQSLLSHARDDGPGRDPGGGPPEAWPGGAQWPTSGSGPTRSATAGADCGAGGGRAGEPDGDPDGASSGRRRGDALDGGISHVRLHPGQDLDRLARLVRDLREGGFRAGQRKVVHLESWESTLAAVRASEHYGLEGDLLDLLRQSEGSRVRFLLGGNEGLAASRALGSVQHVLYLPSARIDDDLRLAKAIEALEPSSTRVLIRSSRLGGPYEAQPVT